MLLSHSHRFLFVHVERTGGTSLFHTLKHLGHGTSEPRPGAGAHVNAIGLRRLLGEDVFDSYFKFGFVRNPWDRELSLFEHARHDAQHSHNALFRRMSFDDYIYWRAENPGGTAFHRLCDPIAGRPLVDFVGRYERIHEDFVRVLERIGVSGVALPRLNASRRSCREYREAYTAETAAIVREVCRNDVELFGYDF